MSVKNNYEKIYKKLAIEFSNDLNAEDFPNIPELYLPLYGEFYSKLKEKILIVGIETNGWGNMVDFISQSKSQPKKAICRNFGSFKNLDFLNWGINFGTSFWDFNFKFLANFYGIDDWKLIKNGQKDKIVKSFAWGNCNSLEGFNVTARDKGAEYDKWKLLKHKSKNVDKLEYQLKALEPDYVLITNWNAKEKWITDSDENFQKEIIDKYIHYYFLPKFETHIIKTAHPRFLASSKLLNFDKINKRIADTFKKKTGGC